MPKKLYRSKKDKMLAGICGGIADYFKVDSTLVRLLAVIFILLGGAGFVVYVIAWIIIPEIPEQVFDDKPNKKKKPKEKPEKKIKKEAEEVVEEVKE